MILSKKIRLFITDIDGVWTDGGMYYGENDVEYKKFSTYDSVGVLCLKKMRIPLAIITGENSIIVKKRAEKLKIDSVHLGVKSKLSVAKRICESFNVALNETAYIGDSINDYFLIKEVGLSACPSTASDIIKKNVDIVLDTAGGCGVFAEFVDKYMNALGIYDEIMFKVIEDINNINQ